MSNLQNPFTPEMLTQIKAGLKRYETLQKNDEKEELIDNSNQDKAKVKLVKKKIWKR